MASNTPPDSKDNKSTANIPRGLLGKSGAPVSKSTRLPSARAARDLTLGGAPRKSFKPTIPVRPKDKTAGPIEDKHKTKEKKPRQERAERAPKRANKNQSNVVQSQSIFEQGPTDRTVKRESIYKESISSGAGTLGTRSIGSTSVAVKNQKQTRQETQRILDDLLQDDFIDDGDEIDVSHQPVALPLLKPLKDEKAGVKWKAGVTGSSHQGLAEPSISGPIFNSEDGYMRLALVQLPDCIPGLAGQDDDTHRREVKPKTEATESQPVGDAADGVSEKLASQCKLSDLSEGRIGKIQVTQSGKARLILGDLRFDLNCGAQCSFLQEHVHVVYMFLQFNQWQRVCYHITDKVKQRAQINTQDARRGARQSARRHSLMPSIAKRHRPMANTDRPYYVAVQLEGALKLLGSEDSFSRSASRVKHLYRTIRT